MESRPLSYVSAACTGELRGGTPETMVSGVATDSRKMQAGDLFVALKGERFDAHDFLGDVAEKGAGALLVEREKVAGKTFGCPLIVVENTRQALGQLAARYRADFELPVIVVGGSNGKTTTKELIAAVLREKYKTLWSEASFNNDVGVPMTLLQLERSHQAAVLEAGTNHPGELAPLVRMIQPRYGVITTIGREHLEFFGDVAGVAEEEGWLAELLPASGKLFLQGDNPWTQGIARRSQARVQNIGLGEANQWRIARTTMGRDGVTFEISAPGASGYDGVYGTPLLGKHQALNAAFAIAIGAELHLAPEQIRHGLAHCPVPKMRMQVLVVKGVTILDDAYNANADSVGAALEALHDYPAEARRMAVLGPMAELGAHTADAHQEAGRCAARNGVAHLLAVGTGAEHTAAGAREAGLAQVSVLPDIPATVSALKALLRPGDVVLLKASRAAGFEKIREGLMLE